MPASTFVPIRAGSFSAITGRRGARTFRSQRRSDGSRDPASVASRDTHASHGHFWSRHQLSEPGGFFPPYTGAIARGMATVPTGNPARDITGRPSVCECGRGLCLPGRRAARMESIGYRARPGAPGDSLHRTNEIYVVCRYSIHDPGTYLSLAWGGGGSKYNFPTGHAASYD